MGCPYKAKAFPIMNTWDCPKRKNHFPNPLALFGFMTKEGREEKLGLFNFYMWISRRDRRNVRDMKC